MSLDIMTEALCANVKGIAYALVWQGLHGCTRYAAASIEDIVEWADSCTNSL
jgi:hypothetical protein